jgi:hypothetical protein
VKRTKSITAPTSDAKDKIYNVVKMSVALLSLDAPDVFSMIVKPPLEKRLEDWQVSVVEKLAELDERLNSITIENLSQNRVFITAIANVTPLVLRTHREDKLDALRNIVLNAALPNAPHDDLQIMFIQMVDTFTSWHVTLLKFFAHPKWYIQLDYPESLDDIPAEEAIEKLMSIFPELKQQPAFTNKVVNDLSYNRLIALPEVRLDKRGIVSDDSPVDPNIITELGKQFLNFTKSPLENDDGDMSKINLR